MKSTAWMTLLCISVLTVGGCQTAGDFCDVASPIYLQPADDLTPMTERRVLAHDEYGEARCGWKPVKG